jgi:hypothetical protein
LLAALSKTAKSAPSLLAVEGSGGEKDVSVLLKTIVDVDL